MVKWYLCGIVFCVQSVAFINAASEYEPDLPTNSTSKPEQPPYIISQDNMKKVWYTRGIESMNNPTASFFYVNFKTSVADMPSSPKKYVLFQLLSSCLSETFRNDIPDYSENLKYQASSSYEARANSVVFKLCGQEEKMSQSVENVFKIFATKSIDQALFQSKKDTFEEYLLRINTVPVRFIAEEYFETLIMEDRFHWEDSLSSLQNITLQDLEDFRKNVFAEYYSEILVYRALNQSVALNLVDKYTAALQIANHSPKPVLDLDNRAAKHQITFPANSDYLFEQVILPNGFGSNSATLIAFQVDKIKVQNQVMLDLFHLMMFDDDMRSSIFTLTSDEEDELDNMYFHSKYYLKYQKSSFLIFTLPGQKHPQLLEARIEARIEKVVFKNTLSQLNDTVFNELKKKLSKGYLQEESWMSERAMDYFDQITNNFGLLNGTILATVLNNDNVTLDNFKKFVENFLKIGSPQRRKFTIHLINKTLQSGPSSDSVKTSNRTHVSRSVSEFRRQLIQDGVIAKKLQ